MTTVTPASLTIAIVDGHRLTDDGLRRVSAECTSVLSIATEERSFADVAARWEALAPGLAIEDGGRFGSIREAIVECARRGVMVIATPTPHKASQFVAQCLQGAASATEFDVPGIAVHVVRDEPRPGSVAWLSDTGELSGYGVLFAVGYAAAHGVGVELIEPTGGLDTARTPEAMDEALARAEQSGVPLTRHTDPSPIARVLRDEHSLVVHPVLDAPGGLNLLHPGHLPAKAVATGSPAVVVELIARFPGDVVAVYDAVHILHGHVPAARIAAAAALGMVTISGVGIALASPASASTVSETAAVEVVQGDARAIVDNVAFGLRFTPQERSGVTDLLIQNQSDHGVDVTVTGEHGQTGDGSAEWERDTTFTRHIPAHESATVRGSAGVTTWTNAVITAVDGHDIPALKVMHRHRLVPPPIADLQAAAAALAAHASVTHSEILTDTGVVGLHVVGPDTHSEILTDTGVVGLHVVGPDTHSEILTDTDGVKIGLHTDVTPQETVLTPTVGVVTQTPGGAVLPQQEGVPTTTEMQDLTQPGDQGPVVGPQVAPGGERVVVPLEGPPSVVTPGGGQTPVADLGGVTVELQQQVTPQVDVVTPTVGVVTQTPGGAVLPQQEGVPTTTEVQDLTQPGDQGPVVGPQVAPGGERVVVPLEGPPSVVTPGGGQTPVADLGGVTVELQQQVTPQVDVVTPTVEVVTQTPGGAQTPVADLGGVNVELQQQVTPRVDLGGPTAGVATQTPDTLLEVGGLGVTSGVHTVVTTPPEIGTPGNPDTVTTGDHGPTIQTTHHQTTHHTTPSGLVDGTDHQAPQGELAHTGGNTAILAIVAGSLIAAGAGLAVAGRMGKGEEDDAAPEG